ncbi:MAG TPA: hypothetical protein VG796_23525 [Verrucomicrobiales bacterium]|nr:hypothetical protein [Verrucomicrobiales bacterium]
MKVIYLALLLLTIGFTTGSEAAPETKPAPPGIKEVEGWLTKDTIIKIRDSVTLPFRASITPEWKKELEKELSSLAQIGNVDSIDLLLVVDAIARPGDFDAAPVWKECLKSTQPHIRFMASACLTNIYGARLWFRGFDHEADPASKTGVRERKRFLDLLAAKEPPPLQASRNPGLKEVEAWITKERIQKICEACERPFPVIGSGQTFEIGGEWIGEGDLMQVARAIAVPEDWHDVPMWEAALMSSNSGIRFLAFRCLLAIHREETNAQAFRYHWDPQAAGKSGREQFLKDLAAAKARLLEKEKER